MVDASKPYSIADADEVRARTRWLCMILNYVGARLYYAQEVRGHNAVHQQMENAFDALYVAAQIADPPLAKRLRELSDRLRVALRYLGHPSDDELQAVAQEVGIIKGDLGNPGREL